jgi:hypothetical protein
VDEGAVNNVILFVPRHTCGSHGFYRGIGDPFQDRDLLRQFAELDCMYCIAAQHPNWRINYPPINLPEPGHGNDQPRRDR